MAIISLDYDGTFTIDPDMWLAWVIMAKARGHIVYCITMRFPQEGSDIDQRLKDLVEVIYTSRAAKKAYVEQYHNISPDIWVDDNPIWVYNNAK